MDAHRIAPTLNHRGVRGSSWLPLHFHMTAGAVGGPWAGQTPAAPSRAGPPSAASATTAAAPAAADLHSQSAARPHGAPEQKRAAQAARTSGTLRNPSFYELPSGWWLPANRSLHAAMNSPRFCSRLVTWGGAVPHLQREAPNFLNPRYDPQKRVPPSYRLPPQGMG